MASLVVSWTRMLEEVQATAEERPLADFEHDEAHFLRARPAAVSGAPRATARPPGAPADSSFHLALSTPAASRPAVLLPLHPAGGAGRPSGSGARQPVHRQELAGWWPAKASRVRGAGVGEAKV